MTMECAQGAELCSGGEKQGDNLYRIVWNEGVFSWVKVEIWATVALSFLFGK